MNLNNSYKSDKFSIFNPPEKKHRNLKPYFQPNIAHPSRTTLWRWKRAAGKCFQSQIPKKSVNDQLTEARLPEIAVKDICYKDNPSQLELSEYTPRTNPVEDNLIFFSKTSSSCGSSSESLNNIDDSINVENTLNNTQDDTQKFSSSLPSSKDECVMKDIIFPQSNITAFDILTMLSALALRRSLSKETINDLLQMLEVLAAKKIPVSNYLMDKQLSASNNAVEYHFYCSKCQTVLKTVSRKNFVKVDNITCDNCDALNTCSLFSKNYFISVDLEYQLKNFLESPEIQKDINKNLLNSLRDAGNDYTILKDISSSKLYHNLKSKFNFDLTFSISTDGAAIFNSSKLSMWPVQIIINELSPKIRYHNVILAGIWVGKREPNMQIYLDHFVTSCKKLAYDGIKIYFDKSIRTMKIFPLLICVDSVARPMIQNITQFNGYYGCGFCYHAGKVVNRTIKYPFNDVPDSNLRNPDEVLSDMREALKSGRRIRGVKGPSVALNLPGFNIVWGYPIDYMHAVCLGVVKQLWELWTTFGTEYYIGSPSNLKLISDRLINIKPPNEIHRLPRALFEKAKWKASEWRSWLLFYCIHCLKGILGNKYLEHFALLQRAIYLLLKKEVQKLDLITAEECLYSFHLDFENLYQSSSMTFNVHLLSHLVKSVEMCGPLWATSTFHFESNIGSIKCDIKGPNAVDKQIVTKNIKKQMLNKILHSNETSASCRKFLQMSLQQVSGLQEVSHSDYYLLGAGWPENNLNGTVIAFNRIKICNSVFCTERYSLNKKNANYVCELQNDTIVKIINIFKYDNNRIALKCKILSRSLAMINNKLIEGCLLIKNNVEETILTVSPKDILNKCLLVSANNEEFVYKFPNTYEIQ